MKSPREKIHRYYIPGKKRDLLLLLSSTIIVAYFHLSSNISFHNVIHLLHYYFFYLIIIYSAHKFGLIGGLISSIILSLIYNPKSYMLIMGYKDSGLIRPFLEIVMMYTLGIFSGLFSQKLYLEKEKLRIVSEELKRSLTLLEESVEEKIRMEKEIAKSDRLRVLGQLTAGIAHEIRNPLATIRSGINLMKSGKVDERIIELVTSEIDRLNNFVDRFLHYARVGKGDEIDIPAGDFFDEVVEFARLTCKDRENVKIESISNLSDDILIKGDKNYLKQAIFNIILNCIEACETLSYLGKVFIKGYFKDKYVYFEISDNGKGINESIKDKIFEPFFTTKEKGTGLGLTIAFKIIKEHNGDITVENNGGARFIIKIPAF